MARQFSLMSASSLNALVAAQADADADPEDEADAGPEPEGDAADGDDAGEGSEAKGKDGKQKDGEDKDSGDDKDMDEGEDDAVEAVAASDAVALAKSERAKGFAAGQKAANARTAKVLGCAEGKARMDDAVFLLTKTEASAHDIIADLAARTGTTSTSADIEDTNVDLGHGNDPNALVNADGSDSNAEEDGWDAALANLNTLGMSGVSPQPAATSAPAPGANVGPGGTLTVTVPQTGH